MVIHWTRVWKVPISNPGADQPDWIFFEGMFFLRDAFGPPDENRHETFWAEQA